MNHLLTPAVQEITRYLRYVFRCDQQAMNTE